MESSDTGPIIAGLLGLLVLGAGFGRRKKGLPVDVSRLSFAGGSVGALYN
jgi:MYXO-CTERM domain-containing protein